MNRFFMRILAGLLCIGLPIQAPADVSVHAGMPPPIDCQSAFEDWLIRTGRPVRSRYRGYIANYSIFSHYHILCYGTPSQVPGNRYDAPTGQYAAHGFSYDEYTVTNTFFPEDAVGISDPRKWNNIDLGQDAAVSWMRLTQRQKEHIKAARIEYMGRDFKMTYTSLKLTEQKCVVIAVPSWNLGFALYTNHYNSKGQLRYGTLHGDGIGTVELAGSIRPVGSDSEGILHIPADKDYIDVTYQVRSYVSRYIGLATSSDLACGGIERGATRKQADGSGPWEMSFTVRYSRTGAADRQPVKRTVTEKATLWVVSEMGDPLRREISASFIIQEDPKQIPESQTSIHCEATLTISGDIGLFRDSKTLLGYELPFNERRFLCLERVVLRAEFKGDTLPEEIIFAPLGENTVTVKVVYTSPNTGYAEYAHILKIMPSSLTWTNRRNRDPYTVYGYYRLGGSTTTLICGGIDITGSVYDLLYLTCAG